MEITTLSPNVRLLRCSRAANKLLALCAVTTNGGRSSTWPCSQMQSFVSEEAVFLRSDAISCMFQSRDMQYLVTHTAVQLPFSLRETSLPYGTDIWCNVLHVLVRCTYSRWERMPHRPTCTVDNFGLETFHGMGHGKHWHRSLTGYRLSCKWLLPGQMARKSYTDYFYSCTAAYRSRKTSFVLVRVGK